MVVLVMLIFDPLEQFSIELFSSFFSNLSISASTSIGRMVFLIFLLVILCFYSLNSIFILNKLQKGIFILFQFVLGIVKDSL